MNLPLHPELGLPIYSADAEVLVTVDEFEAAQRSRESHFVRHTGVDVPPTLTLLESIRISKDHLSKFCRRIGGLIVPHEFGLIPDTLLRDKYEADFDEIVTSYPLDMPVDHLLVARVAVVEPVPGHEDAWMSLGEKIDQLGIDPRHTGSYTFYDLDETQVMYGTLKLGKGRQQPRWWLVDIEPRFHNI